MSQVDVPTSIGYALKRTAVALRSAMDAELRDCDLTVAQYASLELLAQYPGLTNAELARGVFVTRQATHQLLAGLGKAGLIEIQGAGRHQLVVITELGAARLATASHRIALIEQRMLTALSPERRAELFSSLAACIQALTEHADSPTRVPPTANRLADSGPSRAG